ncbi:MAG: LysR substrate-binding domain-containing protein [Myxococcota bacterium]
MKRGSKRRNSRTIPEGTEHMGKAALFVAVARAGSFSKAAEALNMGRSTLSDHVRTLEDSLGVKLLERSTRKLRLTDEGGVLIERMEAALDAWGEARTLFEGRRQHPAGRLRVTCPSGIATTLVAPVLSEMLRAYPDLQAEFMVDDRVRDLVEDGIDVAIRMARLEDSRLIARRLGETPLRVVAAPEIAKRLRKATLDELAQEPWIGHEAVRSGDIVLRKGGSDESRTITPRFVARCSGLEGQVSLLAGGVGLASMPWLLVADEVARKQLAVVEPWEGMPRPLYAIYPAKRLLPQRTRMFVDRIAERATQLAS